MPLSGSNRWIVFLFFLSIMLKCGMYNECLGISSPNLRETNSSFFMQICLSNCIWIEYESLAVWVRNILLTLLMMHDFKHFYWNYPCNWIVCILQPDEPDIADTPVGLLSVVTDDTTHFSSKSISVVIEDRWNCCEWLPWLTDAFVLMFGLIYALHLDYPKKLIHTFTFVQKILMSLDDSKPLKPCLLYKQSIPVCASIKICNLFLTQRWLQMLTVSVSNRSVLVSVLLYFVTLPCLPHRTFCILCSFWSYFPFQKHDWKISFI